MNLIMNGEYFYILRLRFIEPVPKMFYVLLDKDSRNNIIDVNNHIQEALRGKNIVALLSILQKPNDEFDEWYSVAYSEDVLRVCKKPLHFLKYMVLRGLEGRAKLGLGISEIIRIYHSTEGIVDAYLKSIQNQSDKRKEKRMSDNRISPALSKIAERIKQLKQLECNSDDVALDIQKHKNAIEELTFKLDELGEDILHVRNRIGDLCSQAMIREGFTEEYIRQFLKERGYQQ